MCATTASFSPVNQKLLNRTVPALDGLRGVAILLVLAYHFLPSFSFAWVGVDLFFVLSGFLITGKLMESVGSAHYFRKFYAKRIKRILPLYFSVLLVFFIVIPQLFPSFVTSSWHALVDKQFYYWLLTANIDDAVHGFPANVSLVHFWSLACEAQFYLAWPWVIYFLYRRLSLLLAVLLFCVVGALLCRLYLGHFLNLLPVYTYVLLPCRMDAFAIGAVVYLAAQKQMLNKYVTGLALLAALLLLSATGFSIMQQMPWHFGQPLVYHVGFTLNALFWGCVLGITLAGRKNSWKGLLESRPLVFAGKYSYGMYVLHLPVYFLLARLAGLAAGTEKTLPMAGLALLVTCVCSWGSYHLLEKRFLTLKPAN